MLLEEAQTHTIKLLCDHFRCRIEGIFTAVGEYPSAFREAREAGWVMEFPNVIDDRAKIKHYCPDHAEEHRPRPYPWVDVKQRQGEAMMSKGFPPTPPKKPKKAKKKKTKRESKTPSGDLFD